MKKKKVARKKPAKTKRARMDKETETSVLVKSKRRCCVCFGLSNDDNEKEGQIAHLDGDPSSNRENNLVFLCLRHHTLFDSKTSQHRKLTVRELKHYRDQLHKHLKEQEKKARDRVKWEDDLQRKTKEAMVEVSIRQARTIAELGRRYVENSAKMDEAFRKRQFGE